MVNSAVEADEAPIFDEGIELNIEQAALRVVDPFSHILRQMCRADMASMKIRDLDAMTAGDLRHVWAWNARSVSRYALKTAIISWDGELTYTQWDTLSAPLAHHLIRRGVRPGDVLPLIFKESMAGLALCASSTAPLVSLITGQKPPVVQKETSSRATLIDDLLRGQSFEEPMQPTLTDLRSTGSTVFLAGSTGFLETQILHYTLTKRAFDKVVLLIYRNTPNQTLASHDNIASAMAGQRASGVYMWNRAYRLPHKQLSVADGELSVADGELSVVPG
ncbi:hypothetical protein CNMCM8927_000589 [Aspergillus lentulus]|uniref:AMP-dependent synthetase/ligase domain-containing protein n=1 Tax=Aspergillus lentulus TaxID=293939 RepID=A0AAN5YK75_ASPLE|nr:hypothetical protein CNMCM7927_002783 [Aspergillus lentulus]KAF4181164.1 hypothetical protein CNMCM8060_009810 [Aspergillus lentulus]KAF4194470.1 hypothetical protein CNMCM8694_007648 [Aspergillus lentulus]KAF4202160.1 hypothetical protein CNMCM8927_000589 [Aspergillus lentulus]